MAMTLPFTLGPTMELGIGFYTDFDLSGGTPSVSSGTGVVTFPADAGGVVFPVDAGGVVFPVDAGGRT